MCSTDVYCSKQTGSSSTKETITYHFSVSGIGQKKTVDAAKICGGAENVVKTETQQTFVNGLLGFITLGIYTPLEARVLLTIIAWVALPAGNSSALATTRLRVLPAFLQHIRFFLIIPSRQRTGRSRIIHAGGGGGFTHWLTDCFDVQNWRRPAATSSRRASFSALASANSSCILHRAQQHHADASACQ